MGGCVSYRKYKIVFDENQMLRNLLHVKEKKYHQLILENNQLIEEKQNNEEFNNKNLVMLRQQSLQKISEDEYWEGYD